MLTKALLKVLRFPTVGLPAKAKAAVEHFNNAWLTREDYRDRIHRDSRKQTY